MKRFLTVVMTVILLFSVAIAANAFDISPAIDVLRENTSFTKCALKGNDTSFCKNDFVNVIGNDFDYITITKTPDKECGILTISGIEVIEGQSIISESLDLLKFIPSSNEEISPNFTFTVSEKNWKGTDITCNINYLTSINYAPVIKSFDMNTVKNISVYSKIDIYDPNNDQFTFKVGAYPSFGAVNIDEKLKRVTYIPEKNFTGSDIFTIYAKDEYGNISNEATVYVNVDSDSKNIIFGDMANNDLHYAAIALSENNIMTYSKKGGEYYFSPDEEVNKIDFTVMLLCASGLNDGISTVKDTEFLDDLNLSNGRKSYLKRALDVEIIDVGNRFFDPFSQITTKDAKDMVSRSLGLEEDSEILKNIMGETISQEKLTKESVAEILYNVCLYLK